MYVQAPGSRRDTEPTNDKDCSSAPTDLAILTPLGLRCHRQLELDENSSSEAALDKQRTIH